MANHILELAQKVTAGTESKDELVLGDKEEMLIIEFHGSAPQSSKASVLLVWDKGGAAEKVLWVIQHDAPAPRTFKVRGDGIKRIALCLDNGCSSDYFMSGYVKMELVRKKK